MIFRLRAVRIIAFFAFLFLFVRLLRVDGQKLTGARSFDEDAGQSAADHTAGVQSGRMWTLLQSSFRIVTKVDVLRSRPERSPRFALIVRLQRTNAGSVEIIFEHVVAHVYQIVRIVLRKRQSGHQTRVNCWKVQDKKKRLIANLFLSIYLSFNFV